MSVRQNPSAPVQNPGVFVQRRRHRPRRTRQVRPPNLHSPAPPPRYWPAVSPAVVRSGAARLRTSLAFAPPSGVWAGTPIRRFNLSWARPRSAIGEQTPHSAAASAALPPGCQPCRAGGCCGGAVAGARCQVMPPRLPRPPAPPLTAGTPLPPPAAALSPLRDGRQRLP